MAVIIVVVGLIALALLIGARALALSFKEQAAALPCALTVDRPLPPARVRRPTPAEAEILTGGCVV